MAQVSQCTSYKTQIWLSEWFGPIYMYIHNNISIMQYAIATGTT